MSKADGKVYIITYEIVGIKYHHPYVYKTLNGVTDTLLKIQETEWYMNNHKILVITKGGDPTDGEHYLVINGNERTLVRANNSSTTLYKEV